MPRDDITSAFSAELIKTVTRIGYLVQVNASQILRWTDLGDFNYFSVPWVGVDLKISGLSWDPNADPGCTMRIQNLDGAIAAFMLDESVPDITVDIYQFAPGALADGDAPQLARFAVNGCKITLSSLEMKLISQSSLTAFGPRRRVDASNGFAFPLPRGTQIVWGSETLVLEPEDSG